MVSWDSTRQACEGLSSDESHMTFHSPSPASRKVPVTPPPSSFETKSESDSGTLTSLPKIQHQQQQKKNKKRKKQQEEEEENNKISELRTKKETLHTVQQENPTKENKILKAEALERKWHKQHILELEALSARLDYLQEVCKICLEELRKPVRRGRYEGCLPRNAMACFWYGFY